MKVDSPYQSNGKSIALPLRLLGKLPSEFSVGGVTLQLKDEFHITLVSSAEIARATGEDDTSSIKDILSEEFNRFVRQHPIELARVIDDVRLVKDGQETTVVVLVEVTNLEKFFNTLKVIFDAEIPTQPSHITLYLHNSPIGIGIGSSQRLSEISEPIQCPAWINELKFTTP